MTHREDGGGVLKYNASLSSKSRDDIVSEVITLARPLDWSRAADWAASIGAGDLGPMRHVFRKNGAQGPEVVWSPSAEQLAAPPLSALLEYWVGLKEANALPRADRIDPLGMRGALGYVMLVDVVDRGRDVRYRLYGSTLASVSDADMTGRLLSTHGASAYIREFSLAMYRAVLARREPALSAYGPAGALVIAQWRRIILPLVDETGEIIRFLSGAAPVGRDGRVVSTRL